MKPNHSPHTPGMRGATVTVTLSVSGRWCDVRHARQEKTRSGTIIMDRTVAIHSTGSNLGKPMSAGSRKEDHNLPWDNVPFRDDAEVIEWVQGYLI